jgi:hypothetical protein
MAEPRFKLTAPSSASRPAECWSRAAALGWRSKSPQRAGSAPAGALGASLASATATVLSDGRVLVAGGYDDSIRVSRAAWVATS